MIELRDIIVLFRRSLLPIVVAAILGGVLGFWTIQKEGDGQKAEAVVSLRFESLDAPAGSAVDYDGYYIIETQRRFGELLGVTLRNENVRGAFFTESGVRLGRIERITHTDYHVVLAGEGAEKTGDVLQEALTQELHSLGNQLGEPLKAGAAVSQITPAGVRRTMPFVFGGAAMGALVGAFVALWKRYARS